MPSSRKLTCCSSRAPAILSTLATWSGWRPDQVAALLAGKDLGEPKAGTLIAVIREAAANRGRVADHTWASAVRAGWTDQHPAEAFGYLGLAVFASYFLNYAATDLDIPAAGAV
jgi:hypothetical protein